MIAIIKNYSADDVPVMKKTRKTVGKVSIRKSITPGTILILLSGRFKGKRVVFLKQLESGLLLVSGPFSVNGVPLRRVNQAYVIATSTKINVTEVPVTDDFFAVKKSLKAKPTIDALFGQGREKVLVDAKRVEVQKSVDKLLLAEIKKVDGLKQYLNASFALSKGQFPHEMKF